MSKDWGSSKGKFKLIECISALLCEVPGGAFARKPGKGNRNGGVSVDKSSVKFAKPRKDCMSRTFRGSGQSWMHLTLLSAMVRPSGKSM